MCEEQIHSLVLLLRRTDVLYERSRSLTEDLQKTDKSLELVHGEIAQILGAPKCMPRIALRDKAIEQIGRYAVQHAKVPS